MQPAMEATLKTKGDTEDSPHLRGKASARQGRSNWAKKRLRGIERRPERVP